MINTIIYLSVMVIMVVFFLIGLDYYFNKVHKGRMIDTIIAIISIFTYFLIMMIVLKKIDNIFPA